MHHSKVFEINPQIKWFKNCVFFFCLDTKETKNQEQTISPHLATLRRFYSCFTSVFIRIFFAKKMKSSIFINRPVLSKLFRRLYIVFNIYYLF